MKKCTPVLLFYVIPKESSRIPLFFSLKYNLSIFQNKNHLIFQSLFEFNLKEIWIFQQIKDHVVCVFFYWKVVFVVLRVVFSTSRWIVVWMNKCSVHAWHRLLLIHLIQLQTNIQRNSTESRHVLWDKYLGARKLEDRKWVWLTPHIRHHDPCVLFLQTLLLNLQSYIIAHVTRTKRPLSESVMLRVRVKQWKLRLRHCRAAKCKRLLMVTVWATCVCVCHWQIRPGGKSWANVQKRWLLTDDGGPRAAHVLTVDSLSPWHRSFFPSATEK